MTRLFVESLIPFLFFLNASFSSLVNIGPAFRYYSSALVPRTCGVTAAIGRRFSSVPLFSTFIEIHIKYYGNLLTEHPIKKKVMKKLFLGLIALCMLNASYAQKKSRVKFKAPIIKKDKANVYYENDTEVAPPPPPPPPPLAAKAPPPPPKAPRPPKPPKKEKTSFSAPVIVKDEVVK
jgi:hypothetical protein